MPRVNPKREVPPGFFDVDKEMAKYKYDILEIYNKESEATKKSWETILMVTRNSRKLKRTNQPSF